MYIKRSLRHYTYYIIWEYLKEGRKYIKRSLTLGMGERVKTQNKTHGI